MKRLCGQFLARPGLASNQDSSEMLCDTPYSAKRLEHGSAASNHRCKLVFVKKGVL